jgi:hypothetical protein
MEQLQDVDRENGLQLWGIAANTLNSQPRTANMEWFSRF